MDKWRKTDGINGSKAWVGVVQPDTENEWHEDVIVIDLKKESPFKIDDSVQWILWPKGYSGTFGKPNTPDKVELVAGENNRVGGVPIGGPGYQLQWTAGKSADNSWLWITGVAVVVLGIIGVAVLSPQALGFGKAVPSRLSGKRKSRRKR